MDGVGAAEFAGLMAGLGPWGRGRAVAVAVSGGADSLALAWLAARWGVAVGLVVDHGLRPESAAEAEGAVAALAGFGVAARVLRLQGLAAGPGVAARARAARYAALLRACAEAGLVDLLVGHHAADQAETVLMRRLAGSGPDGLAGMGVVGVRGPARLLRPLLGVAPGRLRATLLAAGVGWVEDPSNRDPAATRVRLRARLARPGGARVGSGADGAGADGAGADRSGGGARADRSETDEAGPRAGTDGSGGGAGMGSEAAGLLAEAAGFGRARGRAEAERARVLARVAVLRPEGFAVLAPGPWPAWALGAVLRMVGGRGYPVAADAVAALAAAPRAATLGGARLLPAGRMGPGWLVVREARMAPPVAAVDGAVWDGRFRLVGGAGQGGGEGAGEGAGQGVAMTLGALGGDAAGIGSGRLPAAVRSGLPALRLGGTAGGEAGGQPGGRVVAVPHLGFVAEGVAWRGRVVFEPPLPAAGAAFEGVSDSAWEEGPGGLGGGPAGFEEGFDGA